MMGPAPRPPAGSAMDPLVVRNLRNVPCPGGWHVHHPTGRSTCDEWGSADLVIGGSPPADAGNRPRR
jgi:hypothetical protein